MGLALRGLIAFTLISTLFASRRTLSPTGSDEERMAYYYALVVEAAGAYQRDFRAFDRERTDVARQAAEILRRPQQLRAMKDQVRRNPDRASAERHLLRSEILYQELKLATEKNLFLEKFPALGHVFTGYENPYGEPFAAEGLPTGAVLATMKYQSGYLTPYMLALPVHCVRPDFWSDASCIYDVPRACQDFYTSRERQLTYWQLTEDLALREQTTNPDEGEIDRLARQLAALTPRSREAARLTAKATLGLCGLAAMTGLDFSAEKIQITYSQWPGWTNDIPDGFDEALEYRAEVCGHFSGERRLNLQSLMVSELAPHASMRTLELFASLTACERKGVAKAKDVNPIPEDIELRPSRKPAAR